MQTLNLRYSPNHEDIAAVPGDKRSQVVLSKHNATTAVIFVHGFNGDALDTWAGFQDYSTLKEEFKTTDLYFFGYDGLYSNTLAAASLLYRFLDTLATNPKTLLGSLSKRPDQAKRVLAYKKIVIVAHSLGAVVSRWALIRAAEQKLAWRGNVSVLLFAPAHCGSELSSLTSAALAGWSWLRVFTEGAKVSIPLLRELDPNSRLLRDLEIRTGKLLPQESFLIARRVLIAEREIVVNNLIFAGDPFPDSIPETDHVSICKVDPAHTAALDILTEYV